MTLEKLARVMWRLQRHARDTSKGRLVHRKDVVIAVYREIGTDDRTLRTNVRALKTLEWLVEVDKDHYALGDGYLEYT